MKNIRGKFHGKTAEFRDDSEKTEKDIFFNYNIICVIQVYVKIPILIIHIKM